MFDVALPESKALEKIAAVAFVGLLRIVGYCGTRTTDDFLVEDVQQPAAVGGCKYKKRDSVAT